MIVFTIAFGTPEMLKSMFSSSIAKLNLFAFDDAVSRCSGEPNSCPACKSSVISATNGAVFPPAFCRRAQSCGDPAGAARATHIAIAHGAAMSVSQALATPRGVRRLLSGLLHLGIAPDVSATPACKSVLKHLSTVGVHALHVPVAKEKNGPQQRVRQPQLGP